MGVMGSFGWEELGDSTPWVARQNISCDASQNLNRRLPLPGAFGLAEVKISSYEYCYISLGDVTKKDCA